MLGSGISGGATSTGMLIGGRAVQGIDGGSSGIILMIEMIVCDLVALRDRSRFMGVIFALFSVGTSLGPFIKRRRHRPEHHHHLALDLLLHK